MKKFISYQLIVLVLLSCTKNLKHSKNSTYLESNTVVTPNTKENQRSKTTLESFSSIPDTIDGCSELVIDTNISKSKKKYLFVTNLSEFGIIKVRSEYIYLNKDTSNYYYDERHLKEEYFNSEFKIKLDLELINTLDEQSNFEGIMLFYHNDTLIQKNNVIVESGC